MPVVSKKKLKPVKIIHKLGPDCQRVKVKVTRLGKYFDILNSVLKKDGNFWFRGNANLEHRLTPSALRYTKLTKRNSALNLLSDFRRFGELKLKKPPNADEKFKWIQLAQHYGLPTRLLDWTKNASIALYFACQKALCDAGQEKDGAVFILNPKDLNREANPKDARIYDPNHDKKIIEPYLRLNGIRDPNGLKTIAINPPWNSERIMLQQGVFTLHGSKYFTLTDKHAPSLVYLKIRKEFKQSLLEELERVGINEMSIFPEAEHMCRYLKWRDKLL